MLVVDGVITILNIEPGREIACSTGEALLDQILKSIVTVGVEPLLRVRGVRGLLMALN
jgi:hypothetical protein